MCLDKEFGGRTAWANAGVEKPHEAIWLEGRSEMSRRSS